jgi:hypothetical protein
VLVQFADKAVWIESVQRCRIRAAVATPPRRTHLVSAGEIRRRCLSERNLLEYLCQSPSLCATLVVEPRGQVTLVQPEIVAAGHVSSGRACEADADADGHDAAGFKREREETVSGGARCCRWSASGTGHVVQFDYELFDFWESSSRKRNSEDVGEGRSKFR